MPQGMEFCADAHIETDFGQTDFGQNRLWPKPTLDKLSLTCCVLCVVCFVWCVVCLYVCSCVLFVCGVVSVCVVCVLLCVLPKISLFYFHLPPQNSCFSSLSGGSWNFGGA